MPEALTSVLRSTEAALHTVILVRHRADWLMARNIFSNWWNSISAVARHRPCFGAMESVPA
jgi:hypothetical protein